MISRRCHHRLLADSMGTGGPRLRAARFWLFFLFFILFLRMAGDFLCKAPDCKNKSANESSYSRHQSRCEKWKAYQARQLVTRRERARAGRSTADHRLGKRKASTPPSGSEDRRRGNPPALVCAPTYFRYILQLTLYTISPRLVPALWKMSSLSPRCRTIPPQARPSMIMTCRHRRRQMQHLRSPRLNLTRTHHLLQR
jgi:hypothetical protein